PKSFGRLGTRSVMYLALTILAAIAIYYVAVMFRRSEATTVGVGSTITFELLRHLEPHSGSQLSDDALAELQAEVDDEFSSALADRGLVRGAWRVHLRCDPLTGPECFITNGDREMPLAHFEKALIQNAIELESA